MMKRLSLLKKKKEPEAPAPSPALKTLSRFSLGSSECMSESRVMSFEARID